MTTWYVHRPQKLRPDVPVNRLDVRLVSGRLNVVGTDGPVRVEIERISRRPIVVECSDGRLTVRHDRVPRLPGLLWWLGQLGRRFRAEVSIAIPADATVDAHLVDGVVIASNLRHDTRVDVTSGHVTLLGLSGRTAAKVVSGPVEALGVAGDLTMETVSGELNLAEGAAERVHATTVSGAITCDLDNPRHSEIRLGAISGSVTVRVRQDSDLAVHLHTTSGRITSAFPQLRPIGAPGSSKDRRGVLGTGAGKLWATTTSGGISLLARPVDDEPPDEHVGRTDGPEQTDRPDQASGSGPARSPGLADRPDRTGDEEGVV